MKQILSEDQDLLKTLVTATLNQTMEAEMDDVRAAEKRADWEPAGLPIRLLWPGLITRIGKIELRVPQQG